VHHSMTLQSTLYLYCIVSENQETYLLYMDVCEIPPSITAQIQLANVSRAICRLACSQIYDKKCSGFLYSRQQRNCTLSPYTGEHPPTGAPDCTSNSQRRLEFYRRLRLPGTSFIVCNIYTVARKTSSRTLLVIYIT